MRRFATQFLKDWIALDDRKPLVLRGARQTGKTWLVRDFTVQSGRKLIEINLEKKPELANLFTSNEPKEIITRLEIHLKTKINPSNSLLFLDEIQEAPGIFAKLRWFLEEMPELPIIAAGSLLEFLLENHEFSMPVGRISYAHLEPLSFEEFLLATSHEQLLEYLNQYTMGSELPEFIHLQALKIFREYVLIGGMPAAVASWIRYASLDRISAVHHDLIATYRDDFGKYKTRISGERLDETFRAVPRLLGQKFSYRQVDPEVQSESIRRAIQLLNRARICHPVTASAANGVPLGSELKPKFFKEIFIDTGLACSLLGLDLNHLESMGVLEMVNRGSISEQIVGQMLRAQKPFYIEPALYYWFRDEPNSKAEVDYVFEFSSKVIPVEVKAGATGTLKSLKLFAESKNSHISVRIYSGKPQLVQSPFRLISIPFYLCGQLPRLLKAFL